MVCADTGRLTRRARDIAALDLFDGLFCDTCSLTSLRQLLHAAIPFTSDHALNDHIEVSLNGNCSFKIFDTDAAHCVRCGDSSDLSVCTRCYFYGLHGHWTLDATYTRCHPRALGARHSQAQAQAQTYWHKRRRRSVVSAVRAGSAEHAQAMALFLYFQTASRQSQCTQTTMLGMDLLAVGDRVPSFTVRADNQTVASRMAFIVAAISIAVSSFADLFAALAKINSTLL